MVTRVSFGPSAGSSYATSSQESMSNSMSAVVLSVVTRRSCHPEGQHKAFIKRLIEVGNVALITPPGGVRQWGSGRPFFGRHELPAAPAAVPAAAAPVPAAVPAAGSDG